MRKAIERIIYDNYDIYTDLAECAIEDLKSYDPEYEPTEEEIWKQCDQISQSDWENEKERLDKFFNQNDTKWILVGTVGLWNGTFAGGFVFDNFNEVLFKAGKNCDYFKFWDENGHFFGKCSHHDGTNFFEVKKLTKEGQRLFENWSYKDGKRYGYSEQECHKKIFEKYSTLPNFCHSVYGAKKTDWEDVA